MCSQLYWHGPDFILQDKSAWQRVTLQANLPEKLLKLEKPVKSHGVALMTTRSQAKKILEAVKDTAQDNVQDNVQDSKIEEIIDEDDIEDVDKTDHADNANVAGEARSVKSGSEIENQVVSRIFSAFESWQSTVKLTFWIMKAVNRFLKPLKRQHFTEVDTDQDKVTVNTFKTLEKWWIKKAQQQSFESELIKLNKDQPILKGAMSELRPSLTEDKLIIANLRTKNLAMLTGTKQPPILPKKNDIVTKYVLHLHKQAFHSGVQHTLATVREHGWLMGGRRETRRILNTCLCKAPKPLYQDMAPLPSLRGQTEIWRFVSVDLFGPMLVKKTVKQKKLKKKVWGVIFVCLVSRSIDLYVMKSMSTEQFLFALQKAMARNGTFFRIYSDNGLYFKRASKELKELYRSINWKQVQDYVGTRHVDWTFSPPLAPWYNSASERNIAMVKSALIKVLGQALVTKGHLVVILYQISALLNDRPLGPLQDGADYEVVTPSMLTQGRRLGQLPDMSKPVDHTIEHSAQWFYRKKLTDMFWRIYSTNYLKELGVTKKWKKPLDVSLQEGQLVLLNDPNQRKGYWKKGILTEIHRDSRDQIRSCTIKTVNGSLVRRHVKLLSLFENV